VFRGEAEHWSGGGGGQTPRAREARTAEARCSKKAVLPRELKGTRRIYTKFEARCRSRGFPTKNPRRAN